MARKIAKPNDTGAKVRNAHPKSYVGHPGLAGKSNKKAATTPATTNIKGGLSG